MNKYIAKFEAAKFDPNDILKGYNMTIADLDNMINFLDKYGEDESDYEEFAEDEEDGYVRGVHQSAKETDYYNATPLKEELKKLKSSGYTGLRKWKIDNILNRYKEVEKLIDERITIEDYLLEMTDQGVTADIDPMRKVIDIHLPRKQKGNLDKINMIISYLVHLNKSNRINVELEKITYGTLRRRESIGFRVTYSNVN